jgi:hypothetical protein
VHVLVFLLVILNMHGENNIKYILYVFVCSRGRIAPFKFCTIKYSIVIMFILERQFFEQLFPILCRLDDCLFKFFGYSNSGA